MLALGSHVTYTHRAAVARRHRESFGERNWFPWELTEPRTNATRAGDTLRIMTCTSPITFVDAEEMVGRPEGGRYPVNLERWEKRNKSLFQWLHEGSGVVVGAVRKQYGISVGSSGHDENFDQGYFEPFGQITLYVVKAELQGPQVYVPESHIHLVHGSPS